MLRGRSKLNLRPYRKLRPSAPNSISKLPGAVVEVSLAEGRLLGSGFRRRLLGTDSAQAQTKRGDQTAYASSATWAYEP
jgi:hypothetical protein